MQKENLNKIKQKCTQHIHIHKKYMHTIEQTHSIIRRQTDSIRWKQNSKYRIVETYIDSEKNRLEEI